MRFIICLSATLCLWMGPTEATAMAAKHASFRLNETTWTYVYNGKKTQESIDADGNYVENVIGGKNIDYGTAVMKNNEACFTSAIVKKESCWAVEPVRIGHSIIATSHNNGAKLKLTRVSYVKLSMPK